MDLMPLLAEKIVHVLPNRSFRFIVIGCTYGFVFVEMTVHVRVVEPVFKISRCLIGLGRLVFLFGNSTCIGCLVTQVRPTIFFIILLLSRLNYVSTGIKVGIITT